MLNLNKFLNQNLLPTPRGNNDSKKEITENELDTIISLIEEYDIHKFGSLSYEHTQKNINIHLQSSVPQNAAIQTPPASNQPIIITDSMAPFVEEDFAPSQENQLSEVSSGTLIKAHMSGSVYLKPAPTEDNFISLGDKVQSGDVMCLLEAMKLFSEVKATTSGTISKIFIAHGDIVQEGDTLFEIL